MTFYTHSAAAPSAGLLDRAAGFVGALFAAYANALAYRRTHAELAQLSDRELDDLGLHRGMLVEAARKAVYGA